MAVNEVFAATKTRSVACTDPTTPKSGDPVVYGQKPGVALTDERGDGTTTVAFDGQFTLSVKGIDGSGNAAVSEGDKIYYVSGDTPKLSKKTSGVFFGYAAGAVTSGSTGKINVEVGA